MDSIPRSWSSVTEDVAHRTGARTGPGNVRGESAGDGRDETDSLPLFAMYTVSLSSGLLAWDALRRANKNACAERGQSKSGSSERRTANKGEWYRAMTRATGRVSRRFDGSQHSETLIAVAFCLRRHTP